MSKSALRSLLASLLLATALIPPGQAVNYPTKSYDATYLRRTAEGQSNYRFCTDGLGHVRIETEPPQAGLAIINDNPARSITIFDYPRHESYMLLEKQKLAIRQTMPQDASAAPLDDQRIKELHGKALGTELKFGHPCHGWQWESNGVTTESWTADDLGCPIHTAKTSASGEELLHLQKYVAGSPDPNQFEIPAGYKLTNAAVVPA